MKQYYLASALLLCMLTLPVHAQFRGEEPRPPSVADGVQRQHQGSGLSDLFSMDRLEMRHSVSMSYASFGEQGIGLTMYTNSLRYNIAEPLSLRADVSFMFSPFGTMSQAARENLSGVYLRRASLDYRPSKDLHISLQYRNMPYSMYYNPFYSPYGFEDGLFSEQPRNDLR